MTTAKKAVCCLQLVILNNPNLPELPKLMNIQHFVIYSYLLLQKAKEEGVATLDTVICFACKQETYIGTKGVQGLKQNIFQGPVDDSDGKGEAIIPCTSCKAGEKAVAKCNDCANFLCPNCVMAHQFMRCFENHKVSLC